MDDRDVFIRRGKRTREAWPGGTFLNWHNICVYNYRKKYFELFEPFSSGIVIVICIKKRKNAITDYFDRFDCRLQNKMGLFINKLHYNLIFLLIYYYYIFIDYLHCILKLNINVFSIYILCIYNDCN